MDRSLVCMIPTFANTVVLSLRGRGRGRGRGTASLNFRHVLRCRLGHRDREPELSCIAGPGKVTIDGSFDDWDLSGGIFACGDVENSRHS